MVKQRNPALVAILGLITFGIYALYWLYSTKKELVEKGAQIPTFILIIIPIANIYWLYKYSVGAAQVLRKKDNTGLVWFILFLIIFPVGMYLVQKELNTLAK